ncbi:TPA: hypothetical protein DCW38_06920 [candidate division WOR-3 bacterium]|jgi:hypothetical protein|uniref:Uncharacterized protein n=1 Tax=candidate division WOR-3 bacterium TaxID=2052148 RepID=A0A350HBH8_UNCW3|nr:hypothetical protein [candidate division WOR-3 bacterium]
MTREMHRNQCRKRAELDNHVEFHIIVKDAKVIFNKTNSKSKQQELYIIKDNKKNIAILTFFYFYFTIRVSLNGHF